MTEEKNQPTNTVTFLGTGGARFMIISQLLASGGIWLDLSDTKVLLDPGPGCIVQATKRKLKTEQLSAIIVSHRHLDHAADVSIMVEAMTQGGLRPHGRLFAPADALGNEPVIFSYLKSYLEGIELLQAGKSYSVGNISFTTPVRHVHPVETYGMVFKAGKYTLSYISDTRYFDCLTHNYGGELLIINVVFLQPRLPSQAGKVDDYSNLPVDHLSVPDAELIIKELKPKVAILTHFGMSIWRAKPWEIAAQLSEKTGIRVLAARDGMKFDLTKLEG